MSKGLTWTTGKVKLADLVDYEKNPVQISERALKELAKSLQKYGHIIPYTAAAPKNGSKVPILDGHQRKRAEIEVLGIDPKTVVEVRYPSRKLSEKERQEIIVRLRKNTGEFDFDKLEEFFEPADLLEWGFTEKELTAGGFELVDESRDAEPQVDRAAELLKVWKVKPGDLWQIGDHRLICGDCTDAATVARVMGGEKAAMCFTDPPYNVAYTGGPPGEWSHKKHEKIENDKMSDEDWEVFIKAIWNTIFENTDGAFYVCMSTKELARVTMWFLEMGGHLSTYIIWFKTHFTLSMADYQRSYEQIIYGWKEGEKHYWCGDRNKGDVWEISRPMKSDDHPTMKPPPLMERAIENSSTAGDLVFEPFSGSGSTMVACENLRRRCRAVEISPAYVAVALQRMADAFPELKIERVKDGSKTAK